MSRRKFLITLTLGLVALGGAARVVWDPASPRGRELQDLIRRRTRTLDPARYRAPAPWLG